MTALDSALPRLVPPAGAQPSATDSATAAPRPNRLTASGGRYFLDGEPVFLRSAELQYFRVPAEQWAESIDKLRAAGCNAIASYIPWSWHEPEDGVYDFTGETHPQRDVVRFLDLVRDAGLVFIARPGPFIYAEYEGFGYPSWLAAAIPEALAQRPSGKPAVAARSELYSLRHPAYLERVEGWYRAVAGVVQPYLNNPIVAWQLDNEAGMIYAIRVGDVDFNPDTVARYRDYLRRKYRKPRVLSRRWGRPVRHFDAVVPPGCTVAHVEMSDWQEFFETWVAGYLLDLREIVRRVGIDLPLTVNEAAEYLSPQHPRLKAPAADFYGYDSYTKLTGGDHTFDFPFGSTHHALRFQMFAGDTSPLTCWELGTGWWDWRARVSPAASVQKFGAALAHGLKGYNLYVAQDGRDPGGYAFQFGGLLDEDGTPTVRLEVIARLQTFIARHERELTESREVYDPIAYLDYQPYTRITPETCFPVPLPGLIEPLRYFASFAMGGFHALLQTAGYNVPVVDLESAGPEALSRYRAAVFPSCGYLDRAQLRKLETYVRRGGHLVTFPEPVVRHTDGTPLASPKLWPHQPRTARWLDRVRLIAHLVWRWIVPYYLGTRWKTARVSPGALHLSDLLEPALVGQAASLPGAVLRLVAAEASGAEHARAHAAGADAGRETPPVPADVRLESTTREVAQTAESVVCAETVRGDLRLSEFPDGGEVLLRCGRASAGYRVPLGSGTSTLIGTIPGGAYVTSRYYALSAEDRLALRRLAVRLFETIAPRTIEPDETLEVETVARVSPEGGCFLFVINRLGAQRGTLRFREPAALDLPAAPQAETLFTAFGSTATLVEGGLLVDLQPDDVLVVRLR